MRDFGGEKTVESNYFILGPTIFQPIELEIKWGEEELDGNYSSTLAHNFSNKKNKNKNKGMRVNLYKLLSFIPPLFHLPTKHK